MNKFYFFTQSTLRVGPLFNLSNIGYFSGLNLLCEFLVKEYPEYSWSKNIFPSIEQPRYHIGTDGFLYSILKNTHFAIFGANTSRDESSEVHNNFTDCRIFLPFDTKKIIRHTTKSNDSFRFCGFDVLENELKILADYMKIENDEFNSKEIEAIQLLIAEYFYNSEILFEPKNDKLITTHLYKVFKNALKIGKTTNLPIVLSNHTEIGNAHLYVKLKNKHNEPLFNV